MNPSRLTRNAHVRLHTVMSPDLSLAMSSQARQALAAPDPGGVRFAKEQGRAVRVDPDGYRPCPALPEEWKWISWPG